MTPATNATIPRLRFLPRTRTEILILAGNLVPLVGALVLHWSVLEILLFYVAELCLYELLVGVKMVVLAAADGGGAPAGLAALLYLAHLALFAVAGLLLLGTVVAAVAPPTDADASSARLYLRYVLPDFLRSQLAALLALAAASVARFWSGFLRSGDYHGGSFVRLFLRSLAAVGAGFFLLFLVGRILERFQPHPLAVLACIVAAKSVVEVRLERRRRTPPSPAS